MLGLLMQGKPIFQSAHVWKGLGGLVCLGLNGILSLFFEDNPNARTAGAAAAPADSRWLGPGGEETRDVIKTTLSSSPEPSSLPLNATSPVVEFRSELFEGWAALWVAGLPGRSAGGSEARLEGRLSLFTVSGRFRQALPMADIYTGQEYARPLVNVPGSWVVNSAIAAVKMLSPTSNFGDTENPYVLTPLVTGAHMVTVSERPLAPEDALPAEDCSLWGAGYAACPGPGARRKAFALPSSRALATFNTAHYHTFHFFQNIIDLSQLEVNLGWGLGFDLKRHLGGQPLQLMAKNRGTGQKLWDFEYWHSGLLEDARRAEQGGS
eukprot:jgi/Tetstr1/457033/TSEL_043697.t1